MKATFTQTTPSNFSEAYGLFIGGTDLQGPKQQYTYFLVRQDGQFIIKRRVGGETKTIRDWTATESVAKLDAQGPSINALSIVVGPTVRFLVNAAAVATEPATSVDTEGVAGLRVNHNLDLHVDAFAVTANQSK